MKVLWVINKVIPVIANKLSINQSYFGGGWLTGISNEIINDPTIEFAVCMPSTNISILEKGTLDNLIYYFYPEKNANKYLPDTEAYFGKIINDFQPDVIHVFGTEFPRTYALMNVAPKEKTIISITGMVSIISLHYMSGLPCKYSRKHYIKRILSKFLPYVVISQGQDDFKRRGKYEVMAIQKAKHIIGRTTWDKACVKHINTKVKYHFCNEILHDTFYESEKWEFDKCIPYSIFVSQAGYPIKGFHKLLLALPYIKQRFPQVKIYVAGQDMINRKSKIRQSALYLFNEYSDYIHDTIKRLNIIDNVNFIGILNEMQVVKALTKANVFVLPSCIENSPNSLGEAMLLGVPIVTSCVGGVQDMLQDKIDGYIYPYAEHYMLAEYICKIFDSPSKAKELSQNAQTRANVLFNKEENHRRLLGIYCEICNNGTIRN